MPKTGKCRSVCIDPQSTVFTPEHFADKNVILSIDELEAMRLCDLENLDQDSAAERMGVSRGTLQRILYAARKKVAEALCLSYGIVITGGNYKTNEQICDCRDKCKTCIWEEQ